MRRLAYALLVLFWIAGFAIWRQRASEASPPKPPEAAVRAPDAAPTVGAQLEAAPAPRKPPIAKPARHRQPVPGLAAEEPTVVLHVRSSVGLPLIEVEGQLLGEGWERLAILGDTLEIAVVSSSFRLRAAGHVPAEIQPGVREIVLEPDALLTVESQNIRSWARDLRALPDPAWAVGGAEESRADAARRTGALAEFPDADHLCFAFSPVLLAAVFPGDVELSFARSDGSSVRLRVHPTSGLRAVWRVPSGDLAGCTPFDLRIEGTDPDSHWTHLRLTRLDTPPSGTQREEFGWGSAEIAVGEAPSFPDPLRGRPKEAHLDALALGGRFLLAGQDGNGRYGSIEFEHDGRERTLALLGPLVIRGSAVDARDSNPIPWARVRVAPEEHKLAEWRAEGEFEIRLPQDWALALSAAIEPPERLVVDVVADGHRSKRLRVERKGRREIDLGAIALDGNSTPIRIAASEFRPTRSAGVQALTFADRPEEEWAVAGAFCTRDDEREIELAFDSDLLVQCRDLVSGESAARPFSRAPGQRLLLALGNEPLALSLGSDGKYQMLPRSVRTVSVDCAEMPKDGGTWTLGWSGGGTWAAFRKIDAKGRVADGLALPEMATELWWSAGEAPADLCKRQGGALVLSEGAQSLVLR